MSELNAPPSPPIHYASELAIARALAERAGVLIASRWDTSVKIEHKGVVDLVTEVDLAAERLITDGLRVSCPEDIICAEEGTASEKFTPSTQARARDRIWYIDPLDGTTNFSHGFPHFCTSIALCEGGVPVVGVIYEPLRRWSFYATKGSGAWLNGRALKVSGETSMSKALLATGFPYDRHTSVHNNVPQASAFLKRCQGLRRAGAAALDLAYLSAGWLDGYWEYKLNPWDIAAGGLILNEAGGTLTDDTGEDEWLERGTVVASSSLALHRSMIAMLSSVSAPDEQSDDER